MRTERIEFASGDGACVGWLYRPDAPAPHPLVVLAHGFGATHALAYWRTAEAIAAAGYAVLDFDPRHLGASPGEPRQVAYVPALVEDLRAALRFARGLESVDPARIALYGSSLGGGLAIEVAADDRELAALTLVVPHVDGRTNLPDVPPRARLRLIGASLLDRAGRSLGCRPRLVPVFGMRGVEHAILSSDGADEGVEEEVKPGGRWVEPLVRYEVGDAVFVNRVAAWEVLGLVQFRPGRRITEVRAPIFMALGKRDRVTPIGPQRRVALRAGARVYEGDFAHFDPFRKSQRFDEVMALLLAFLREHVPPAAARTLGP